MKSARQHTVPDQAARRAATAAVAVALVLAVAVVGLLMISPARAAGDGAVSPLPTPRVQAASLTTILAAARAPGARAVLVNVWATWCEPCQDEMPDLLRFYRENRPRGLRLVLISADDEDRAGEAARVLSAAAARAGLTVDFDALLFLKRDDDMTFINGLDPRWSGALPATFLYDGAGRRTRAWLSPVTYHDLQSGVGAALTAAPLTDGRKRDRTGATAKGPRKHPKTSRRQP